MIVIRQWVHPRGSTIDEYDNGTIVKRRPNGQVVATSATAEKLAAGHGGWTLVPADGPAPVLTAPAGRTAESGRVLRPMRFMQADVLDLEKFVHDDRWVLQQKVDGIRAQLVMDADLGAWFRSSSGQPLVNSTAAPTVASILGALPTDALHAGHCVDGEILNGTFYAFDLARCGPDSRPLTERLDDLARWVDGVADRSLNLKLLPTARTTLAKQQLVLAVYERGGEGWIAKSLTGGYDWGERVEHSLKVKLTRTLDAVVLDRNRGDKQSMTLGLYDADGQLIEVGSASAIGKPDAAVGQVVEVKYLYVGSEGRLVQPTVLQRRDDKPAASCRTDQLHFVNKDVIDVHLDD